MKENKYFICTYTNRVKDYCDEEFFENIGKLQKDNTFYIVDNTPLKFEYWRRLNELGLKHLKEFELYTAAPTITAHQFHTNVLESVLFLREQFLKTDLEYFLIIESDVKPPVNLLDELDRTIGQLPKYWGILGGLYYEGFHNYKLEGINETGHCLSGCTVYKRDVIKKYPFRIDVNNLAAFPDALICYDVLGDGIYKMYDNHDIKCDHMHTKYMTRQSRPL